MKIGKVIETYGGQLFISTEDGNYVDPFTGKIWSIVPPSVLRIYDSPINDSLKSGKIIWEDCIIENDIVYEVPTGQYGIVKELKGTNLVLKGYFLHKPYNCKKIESIKGWVKIHGKRALLRKLKKVGYTLEDGKFIKLITKKEISEKFGLDPDEIKIV